MRNDIPNPTIKHIGNALIHVTAKCGNYEEEFVRAFDDQLVLDHIFENSGVQDITPEIIRKLECNGFGDITELISIYANLEVDKNDHRRVTAVTIWDHWGSLIKFRPIWW